MRALARGARGHRVPRFRMLMLTLERCGVRAPAMYETAARRGSLTSLDDRDCLSPSDSFRVPSRSLPGWSACGRSMQPPPSRCLRLVGVALNHDGRYAGAMGKWVGTTWILLMDRAKPEGANVAGSFRRRRSGRGDASSSRRRAACARRRVRRGAVGRQCLPRRHCGVRRRRLRRIREKQGGPSLDARSPSAKTTRWRSC
jgi:hypothetical protein